MGTSDELTKQSGVPGPTGRCEHREHAALKESALVTPGSHCGSPQHWQPHYRGTGDELNKQSVDSELTGPYEHSGIAALMGSSAVEPVHTTGLIPLLGQLLHGNK